jgi:hypothetical protein
VIGILLHLQPLSDPYRRKGEEENVLFLLYRPM